MRASRSGNILKHVDWQTIGIFLVLILFGWLNIYGASYNFDQTSIFDFDNRAGKQFVWILGSLVLGGVLLMIDYRSYDILAYLVYGVMLLLLLATPFLVRDIKGSLSWINLGPVSLQPAEFAKCAVALAVAMGLDKPHLDTIFFALIIFVGVGIVVGSYGKKSSAPSAGEG
jgi:rod shape determining protein RodA